MAIEDTFEMKILAGNLFIIDDDGGGDNYGSSLVL